MAQVIARIYAAADKAASAVKEVKGLGYGDSEVFVYSPSAGAAKGDLAAGLSQAGAAKDAADALADEVLKGRSVVLVHAAFGGGAKVTAALEKFDPIAAPQVKAAAAAAPAKKRGPLFTGDTKHNDATPLSNALGWPSLIDSATPFSDYFKWPVLSAFKTNVQLKDGLTTQVQLSDDPAPLSRKFGWALLKDDPTPLSNKFNLAVLKD